MHCVSLLLWQLPGDTWPGLGSRLHFSSVHELVFGVKLVYRLAGKCTQDKTFAKLRSFQPRVSCY